MKIDGVFTINFLLCRLMGFNNYIILEYISKLIFQFLSPDINQSEMVKNLDAKNHVFSHFIIEIRQQKPGCLLLIPIS